MLYRNCMPVVLTVSFMLILTYANVQAGQNFNELSRLADKYGTDKGKLRTELYDLILYPLKNDAEKVFEIGILDGASLKMFQDYFTSATIYGIDIDDKNDLETERIKTFIADQAERVQLKKFIDKFGGDYDLILDDGGHSMRQQQVSAGFLFPYVIPGGYYVIEDLHTSFLTDEEYGVNTAKTNTTLQMVYNYIETGEIKSEYLTKNEIKYLMQNISYSVIYSRNNGKSILCVFKKDNENDLTELANEYGTDKGAAKFGPKIQRSDNEDGDEYENIKYHNYTEFYYDIFLPIKTSAQKICEIGIAAGASLKMFRDYFSSATIYGIDIEDCSFMDSDRIKTFVADQEDREQLKGFVNKYGSGYDLILDDGGHTMGQQQVSFGYLFKQIKSGGYYIIEDVHTSLTGSESDGVDEEKKNTTLTMIKKYTESGIIESKYLTLQERKYLTENIISCTLFSRNNGNSITCVLKKK
ncbi:MAG: hypothetical protein WC955_09570 [Elusimicrobiota bacterium]